MGTTSRTTFYLNPVTPNSNGQIVIAFTQGAADNPFIRGIELYVN
jgi:hypothetical protein